MAARSVFVKTPRPIDAAYNLDPLSNREDPDTVDAPPKPMVDVESSVLVNAGNVRDVNVEALPAANAAPVLGVIVNANKNGESITVGLTHVIATAVAPLPGMYCACGADVCVNLNPILVAVLLFPYKCRVEAVAGT